MKVGGGEKGGRGGTGALGLVGGTYRTDGRGEGGEERGETQGGGGGRVRHKGEGGGALHC